MEGVRGDGPSAAVAQLYQRRHELSKLFRCYLDKSTPHAHYRFAITMAFCVAFVMTFFSLFDFIKFWPTLLFYWLVLLFVTMKRQIMHMIKYKYIPFNIGKQKYGGKKPASSASSPRD